jgi:hypothetical protein
MPQAPGVDEHAGAYDDPDLLDMSLEPAPCLAYGQPDRIYDDVPELPHLSFMGQCYILAHWHNYGLLVMPPV